MMIFLRLINIQIKHLTLYYRHSNKIILEAMVYLL